jgi:hypothetical protein
MDKLSKWQFLVDSDSDLCIYPASSFRDAGNGSTITSVQLTALPSAGISRGGSWWPTSHIPSSAWTSSHFGLMVDCRNNGLLDGVTSLSATAKAASSLIPRVRNITGGTPIYSLLA